MEVFVENNLTLLNIREIVNVLLTNMELISTRIEIN